MTVAFKRLFSVQVYFATEVVALKEAYGLNI